VLFAPDKRIVWRRAWQRWCWAEFVMNEIWRNEQATVEQTVVAVQVLASWQKYWFKYHPKPRVQEQACDAWLNTVDVLEEHWRQTQCQSTTQ
jgi:hypothetical protein